MQLEDLFNIGNMEYSSNSNKRFIREELSFGEIRKRKF
jgi:hypothetical protein